MFKTIVELVLKIKMKLDKYLNLHEAQSAKMS